MKKPKRRVKERNEFLEDVNTGITDAGSNAYLLRCGVDPAFFSIGQEDLEVEESQVSELTSALEDDLV